MPQKRNILERLDAGEIIIGDGGYTYVLERRGYMKVGVWTPEVVLKYPNAVNEIHREFALCGADVLEAFVFNGTDCNLNNGRSEDDRLDCNEINNAGCKIVKEIASEYGCLVAGPLSATLSYKNNLGKEAIQQEFQRQVNVFKDQNVDFLIAEFIAHVEEAVWAVEIMKKSGLPVAVTLCIGPLGDLNGVSVEECGIRLVKAGADIIGANCRFEPMTCIETVKTMKQAIEKGGYKTRYMCQPVGYRTHGVGKFGFVEFDETPLALESRLISRWDAHKFARKAYEAGIGYIGGCCGFEPYHIRALAEELEQERGRLPKSSHGLEGFSCHPVPVARKRNTREYWLNLIPGDGRDPLKRKEANKC